MFRERQPGSDDDEHEDEEKLIPIWRVVASSRLGLARQPQSWFNKMTIDERIAYVREQDNQRTREIYDRLIAYLERFLDETREEHREVVAAGLAVSADVEWEKTVRDYLADARAARKAFE